jgi:hypothetical protein
MHRSSLYGLVIALITLVTPLVVQAGDPDPDQRALASELQVTAIEAMSAGDWTAAEERARAALSLDGSVRTSQARFVLARALEQRAEVREALEQIEILLGMELFPQHRQKAEEIKTRLEARAPTGPAPPTPEQQRIIGFALAAGGAVPLGLGITFIGFDVSFASQGIDSGTWAILGTTLLATGIALEVVGLHLILTAPKDPGDTAMRRLDWMPTAGVFFDPRIDETTLQLGVVGRW